MEILATLSPAKLALFVGLLSFVAVLAALYGIFFQTLSGRDNQRRRLEQLIGNVPKQSGGTGQVSETRRKQSIEKALSEMASRERAKQRAKLTLKMRISQADLAWTVLGFYLRTLGLAVGIALGLLAFTGLATGGAVVLGTIVAFVLINLYIQREAKRRMKRFTEEFPNAIDIITRGVKTGLPLGDCLRAVAHESQAPVRVEFALIVDDLSVGLPMAQALNRFTQRVPLMESNFFAVVVTMQSQLGGNLSEALGNLSRVLRDRKMMKEKIKAFSAEATASGGIIASMPVVVAGILSLTSPDYIGLLFSETLGNIVLTICAIWMLIGVTVMRGMIRFDF